MDSFLTSRPSLADRLAQDRRWRSLQAALDADLGTESVEAAMRAAGADPDAYLARRTAARAVDAYAPDLFGGAHRVRPEARNHAEEMRYARAEMRDTASVSLFDLEARS
jgi:hypothetical protein